ncbi:MOSC domain-containing protein [Amycolatopsis sacchari]|uniref:MOSC domain-containing protein n=1 Tax=Amycolatopsis sacchari TaxID=115433 RepID=A0A1I3PX00_9PSEU|nr:MOSC domain-containing protein [Amycolatopsis sacchari]SFJ25721.1 MOSC domain-containing protein [Amycolatopsis sacchari]
MRAKTGGRAPARLLAWGQLDFWHVGADLVLEMSGPRIPCATFQGWLRRDGWLAEFTLAARPGASLRVISPGEVRAGDPVELVHRPQLRGVTQISPIRRLPSPSVLS